MTSNAAETILIAGAGIAGLTAAIALEQAGFHVQVVEQSPALRALGAGLTLQPNAMSAYALLGLEEAIGERGFLLRGGAIRRADGVVLTQMQPSDQLPNLGVAIHRARLLELLAQQLRVPILFGRRGCGYRQDEEGVSLELEDGERLEGALLLACDGIHSAIRAQMLGEESLRYAGYTCWRGIAPALEGWTSRESAEHWGVGRRFGIVPIAEEEIYWFATANAAPNEEDGEDVRGELLERFADFCEPIPALIATTEASSILRNDILDRPPVKRWGDGRVTLVGDAAHPMTPNLGQGACQSIEDAVVLARVLAQAREEDREQGARSGALVGALRRYEALRIPRTAQIVEQAYRFGHVTQIESSSLRWLRNTAVRAIPNWVTERATQDLMQLRLPH